MRRGVFSASGTRWYSPPCPGTASTEVVSDLVALSLPSNGQPISMPGTASIEAASDLAALSLPSNGQPISMSRYSQH